MKPEERITKTPEDAPPKAGRRPYGRAFLLVLVAAFALAFAINSYLQNRPTTEAEIARIEALIVAGKSDEARALMVGAQTRSKDVNALRLRIGRSFLREGLIGPATALLSQVQGSLEKEERLAIAEYFLVAGDPFSAARFYEAAMKSGMPRTASLLGRYGEALALSANPEAAVQVFKESLQLDGTRPRVRLNLALTLANTSRPAEARIETLAVLKLEPENEKALGLLAALGGAR